MYRVEIIANISVQDDIIDKLEENIENFFYSIIPVVHGRGRQKRRQGSTIWPEENFILISYVESSSLAVIKHCITMLKEKFPTEGIKIFAIADIE